MAICRKLHGSGLMSFNQRVVMSYLVGSLGSSSIWLLPFWRKLFFNHHIGNFFYLFCSKELGYSILQIFEVMDLKASPSSSNYV